MSLLDDVSIVVTPNGYKAGTLYGVIPSSGAADMDVTRATAGTRVDENGLVNYAEVLGGEEVTNGDFATDLSGWTINNWDLSEWTSQGLHLQEAAAGQYATATQNIPLVVGKTYNYSVTLVQNGAATILLQQGSNTTILSINSSGTYTGTFVASQSGNFGFKNLVDVNNADWYISNVSLKEVNRNNVPRIDYTGGGCPHILAEPQRTNSFTYSEDFNQSSWSKIGITVTPNSLISPDGTQNAGKLVATNGASNKIIYQSISANTYTASVFAKKGEFEGLLIATGTTGAFFNLNTYAYRTHYTNAPTSYKIENYGNGWYRYSITFTQSSSDNLYIGVNDNVSTTFAITGNGTSGIYTFGAQLEEGSYPTSYIPTSGSTVTRNADIFQRDGISSLINSTEGVLFAEMSALANDGTFRIISLSDGTGSNRLWLYFTVGSNLIQVFDGTTIMAHTIDVTNMIKVAAVFDSNGTRMWVNGSQVGSNSYVGFSGFDRLNFSSESGSNNFFGKIKQVQVYDTALTDNQLIQLTGEAGTHFFESYSEMAETLTYTIQ